MVGWILMMKGFGETSKGFFHDTLRIGNARAA
jgi:hypothetical protein